MLFKHNKFLVAVYLRLSREDGDKTETDQWALENGYVSIVPVEMYDMTSYSTLELLKGIIK